MESPSAVLPRNLRQMAAAMRPDGVPVVKWRPREAGEPLFDNEEYLDIAAKSEKYRKRRETW